MRSIALAAAFAAIAIGFPGAASAGVVVNVKKAHYEIAGKTGAALLDAMERRGPKHGFLTRAIAQTRYSVGWDMMWAERNRTCRVKKADARLSMTYTFPHLTGDVSPQLRKRWARFMKGVVKHEETHGTIARQMVRAAELSIAGLATSNDPACRKARAEAKRRVEKVYAQYERRQILFDLKEHGEGGNVERLVTGLKGRN